MGLPNFVEFDYKRRYEKLSEAISKASMERNEFLAARLLLRQTPITPEEAWDAALRCVRDYEKKWFEEDNGAGNTNR